MGEKINSRGIKLTRRRMLALAAGGLISAASYPIFTQTPLGAEVVRTLLIGARPIFEGTPLEILTPANTFASSQAYRNQSQYTERSLRSNLVVGFGDSNMWGDHVWPPKTAPTSVLSYLQDLVHEEYGAEWAAKNLAVPGYNTEQVKTELVLGKQNIDSVLNSRTGWDIFLNAGGNDFKDILDSPHRAAIIQKLSSDPVSFEAMQNAPELKSIAEDLYKLIQSFGTRFNDLLTTVADTYLKNPSSKGPKNNLQHITVITAPDFSKTTRVDSSQIGEVVYEYQMQHPLVQKLTQDISIHLNDQMAMAMNQFMMTHPEIPILAINTFDFDNSHFGADQHWNEKGKKTIAERYLSRLIVT